MKSIAKIALPPLKRDQKEYIGRIIEHERRSKNTKEPIIRFPKNKKK
jgi:hypothetical protein